jgi:hypothetical protein
MSEQAVRLHLDWREEEMCTFVVDVWDLRWYKLCRIEEIVKGLVWYRLVPYTRFVLHDVDLEEEAEFHLCHYIETGYCIGAHQHSSW